MVNNEYKTRDDKCHNERKQMKKAYQIKATNEEDTNNIIQHEKRDTIRLNKYISSSGFCSRRAADRYIEAQKVSVDGEIASLTTQVRENQCVIVDGNIIQHTQKLVYIALHKPVGITCTTDTEIEDNIVDYMQYEEPIFPIGRLDKDSSGLILLTNDGDIVNKILRAENHHEKEYIVRVNQFIRDENLEKLRSGVQIYNPTTNAYQITKPALVSRVNANSFRLVLSEGLNRQIRRMCTAVDCRVIKLERVRIMNITLDHLGVGEWRYLRADELRELNTSLQDSQSTPK